MNAQAQSFESPDERFWTYWVEMAELWAVVDNEQRINRIVATVAEKGDALRAVAELRAK